MNAEFIQSSNCKIIDGKKISQEIQNKLRIDIEEWANKGHRAPCLIAILVGEDAASQKYVENKMIAAQHVGILSKTIHLPKSSTEEDIIAKIRELNDDSLVDGILVQLPVPEHVSERNVCNAVNPMKDVDGFHIMNMGKLTNNMETFIPCTALGVIELIKRKVMFIMTWIAEGFKSDIQTFGKNVVVCGRSKNVGLPIALLLHSDARNECPGLEATVTLCHRHTPPEELKYFTRRADIIVSATGVVNLITADIVKPGACIIDVGITRIQTKEGKTKLVGDVDFENVRKIAGYITPVPGGVGPMTVAMLMANTFQAAKKLAAVKNLS